MGTRERMERESVRERETQKKMEKERETESVCLFGRRTLNTWSRCTHGSYGSRLEKIKKPPHWRNGENRERVRRLAGKE